MNKLILTLGLALACLAPAAANPIHTPVPSSVGSIGVEVAGPEAAFFRYHVMYRPHCHAPWQCYGVYDCRFTANRVARQLRFSGFETFIRRGY